MALARSAPRRRPRGGLRIPSQAPARKDCVGLAERPTPDSRIRGFGLVHPSEPVPARPQGHGAVQYSVADAVKTCVVPAGPAGTRRPVATEEDQAADRA